MIIVIIVIKEANDRVCNLELSLRGLNLERHQTLLSLALSFVT